MGSLYHELADMTAGRVDAVIAAVERHDAELANCMRVAADGLTAGEGEERISQSSLQAFLWYELPRRYPHDVWRPVAEAAGVLLTLLGLDRYAAIARSSTTTAVLDAWENASAKGFAQFRAANAASGVEPPDTELLAWGEVFGIAEAAALQSVEVALERAIVAGAFQPGGGSWRRVATEVCDRVLMAPSGDGAGPTHLQAVLEERTDTWVRAGHPAALRVWRDTVRTRDVPRVEPSEVAVAIAPMRWLLERCRAGVTLTQAGYLPPAAVHEAVDQFGWWEWRERPRTEADVPQFGVLRDTAARLHLLSTRSRRLGATRRGAALADEPTRLWHVISTTLACEDEYLAMLSELIAHRLLAGPANDDALERVIGPIIAAQGWRAGRESVTAEQAGRAVHRALYHWRLFSLLDEIRPRWEGGHPTGPNVTGLNPAGRSAAIAFLRARATAPAHRSSARFL